MVIQFQIFLEKGGRGGLAYSYFFFTTLLYCIKTGKSKKCKIMADFGRFLSSLSYLTSEIFLSV